MSHIPLQAQWFCQEESTPLWSHKRCRISIHQMTHIARNKPHLFQCRSNIQQHYFQLDPCNWCYMYHHLAHSILWSQRHSFRRHKFPDRMRRGSSHYGKDNFDHRRMSKIYMPGCLGISDDTLWYFLSAEYTRADHHHEHNTRVLGWNTVPETPSPNKKTVERF